MKKPLTTNIAKPAFGDGDDTYNKLLMLFVLDTMEITLTESSLAEMCTSINNWITYMDCILTLAQLAKAGFVYAKTHEKIKYYTITPDGRDCLSHFFSQIPASIRNEIKAFVKEHRMSYKRKQEYKRDFFRREDGSHTVKLKIVDHMQTTLELTLNVPTRAAAKKIHNKWEEKAAQVFLAINELLLD